MIAPPLPWVPDARSSVRATPRPAPRARALASRTRPTRTLGVAVRRLQLLSDLLKYPAAARASPPGRAATRPTQNLLRVDRAAHDPPSWDAVGVACCGFNASCASGAPMPRHIEQWRTFAHSLDLSPHAQRTLRANAAFTAEIDRGRIGKDEDKRAERLWGILSAWFAGGGARPPQCAQGAIWKTHGSSG